MKIRTLLPGFCYERKKLKIIFALKNPAGFQSKLFDFAIPKKPKTFSLVSD